MRQPFWYSPTTMMADEREPLDSPPVQPPVRGDHLECEGKRVNRKLEHVGTILTQLDIALACLARALELLGTHEVRVETFRTEMGPRAQIIKNGTHYDVSVRPLPGGS